MASRNPFEVSDETFGSITGRPSPMDDGLELSDDDFFSIIRSRPQPAAAEPPPIEDPTGVGFGDYAASIMSGGANLAQGFGYLARIVGAERIGGAIEELGARAVDYWNDQLSDSAKDALSREFVRKNAETGEWEWGDPTLNTVGLMGAQSLLGTAAGMGVGAGVTRVLQLFANPMGRTVLTKAAQAGSVQAAKKLRLVDRVIGAAGFGVGEGAVGAGQSAIGVDQAIRRLPPEKLLENPRYQQIYNSTDETMSELERHQYATDTIAREAGSLAGWQAGLTTALLGAPMGAFFGSVIGRSGRLAESRLRSTLFGAAGEAGQEAAQSAAEGAIGGNIRRGLGETELDILEEALNQAVGGAAAGAALGGAVGAVDFQSDVSRGTSEDRSRRRQPDTTTPLRNAAVAAANAGAPREQVVGVVQNDELDTLGKIRALRDLEQAAVEQRGPVQPSGRERETPLDVSTPIDQEAHQAATSPLNQQPEPTPSQKEAGNYPKGHIKGADVGLPGYDISIENPRGSVRRGTSRDGTEWETVLPAHYGDLKGTIGADGEELDVYVGQAADSDRVFLLHQKSRATGGFDEHKVMVGFGSQEEALEAARTTLGTAADDVLGPVVELSRDGFLDWVQNGNTTAPHPQSGMEGRSQRVEGAEAPAVTPAGNRVNTRYALIEAPDAITSHTFTGRKNPRFPQELQPRDRERAGLRQWIIETANRFEPALAVEGVSAGEGAPIVGPDNVVESGNGRTAVIMKLYHDDNMVYRDYLAQNAEKFGLTREQVEGMSRPLLVRVRQDAMDMQGRVRFAQEANRPTIATFSATEQANADAQLLSDEDLATFNPTEDGNVLAPGNDRFIQSFVARMPASERAGLMTAEGRPTRQLAQRVQAAIFAKAYQDDRVLQLMAEEANPDVRNIVNALTRAAPAFARARGVGALEQADVVEPMMQAVELIRQSRARGQSMAQYLDQQGLFEQIPEETARMARFIDSNIRSAKRMGEAFTAMAEFLEREAVRRRSGSLLGPEPELDVDLALQAANQRMEAEYAGGEGQAILFEPKATYRGGSALFSRAQAGAGPQMDMFVNASAAEEEPFRVTDVRAVQTGTFETPVDFVLSPEDAAGIVAPIAQQAQENLVALVTDIEGRPLAVVRHVIGLTNQAAAQPAIFLGQMANIPGAAQVWMAHNHPGGDPAQSGGDNRFTANLQAIARRSGLKIHGMIVVAPGTNKATFWKADPQGVETSGVYGREIEADRTEGQARGEIPFYGERVFAEAPEDARYKTVSSPVMMRRAMDDWNLGEDDSGVWLFNTRNTPVAWVPMPLAEMNSLRTGSTSRGMLRLAREIERSNASVAVVKVPEEGVSDMGPMENVANFLTSVDVRVLDGIVGRRMVSESWGAQLKRLQARGAFYSRVMEPVGEFISTHRVWNVDEIYQHAIPNQQALAQAASEIETALGVEFKNPGVKKRARVEEKITKEGYAKPGELKDVVRGGFAVDSIAETDQVLEMLGQRFDVLDKGTAVYQGGYIDRKALIRFPDGQVGEIQFWPPEVARFKLSAEGERLYNEQRTLPVNGVIPPELMPRYEETLRRQREAYAPALAASPGWADSALELAEASDPEFANQLRNLIRQAGSAMGRPEMSASATSTGVQEAPGVETTNAARPPPAGSPTTPGLSSRSRYASTAASGRGLMRDTVARAIRPWLRAVEPLVKFEVVQSVSDLPDPNAPPDVEGAYFQDGRVYMVADNLTPRRVLEVFRHEVFGHMAIERNDKFRRVLREVENAIMAGGLRELVSEVRARQGLLPVVVEAKEVVALMAEKGRRTPMLDRIASTIRGIGKDLGLPMEMSREDLNALVRAAGRDLVRDARIMRDFQAAQGTPEVQALNKANPSDDEILAAIDRVYAYHGDFVDSPPAPGWRPDPKYPGPEPGSGTSEAVFSRAPDTAAFKEWFGDSKVVDESGEPLVLYHGTDQDFSDFRYSEDIGFHFGTQNQANERAGLDSSGAGNVMPVHLRIENPLRMPDLATWSPQNVKSTLQGMGIISEKQADEADIVDMETVRDWLAEKGFDGIVYQNNVEGKEFADQVLVTEPSPAEIAGLGRYVARTLDGEALGFGPTEDDARQMARRHMRAVPTKPSDSYIAFDPSQIKSATGNRGTFDPTSPDITYSRAGAIPAETPNEVQEMLDRLMAPPAEAQSIIDRGRELVRNLFNIDGSRIRQGLIDSADAIKQIEQEQFGAVLDASESPYKAALATRNLPSVMAAVMKRGVPVYREGVFQLERGRKGIVEIFQPLTEHADGNLLPLWELYAAAKRAKALKRQGREKLFSDEDIRRAEALGQQYPELEQVAREWETFNNQVLDLAVDRGVLDRDMAAKWRENFYVPFYRAMEEASAGEGPGQKGGLSAHGGQRVKRRLRGSEKPLGRVFENMLMNTAYLIDEAYKNTAMEKIATLAEGMGMERVPLNWESVTVPNSTIERALREAGVVVGNVREDALGTTVIEGLTAEQRAEWSKLFRRVAPVGNDIVSFYREGKPVYYRVTDDLLLRSIGNMGFDNFSDIFGLFRGSKRLLTGAITLDPAFMMANWIRDTLSTWVVADAPGLKPFTSAIQGAASSFAESEDQLQIMMGGGGGGGIYDMQPADVRKFLVDKLGSGSAARRFQQSILHPKGMLRFWRKLGNAAENANRVAIYKAVRDAGGSQAEAVYQARDVLNFSMSGDFAAMRWLTATVPFMNARIQGLYRLWRGAKEHPVGFAMKGSAIMAATLALLLRNQDREEYEQLPEWDRDMYWHFFVGGEHFRLPKPFEVGAIFATMPERMFRTGTGRDSPDILKERVMGMLGETFAFNPIPQLAKPMIEQYANRSFFFGSPIVGMAELQLQPEAQYTPWTSETMRLIAETMPDWAPEWLRSPRRLEAALRGYLGAMGTYAMDAGDVVVRNALGQPAAPSRNIYDAPVVKRFLQDPNPRYTKYSDQLYEMLDEANAVFSTINRYKRQGRLEAAQELMEENRGKLAVRSRLNRISTQVRNINNQVRIVMFNQSMTPDEKRDRIDELTARKNQLTAMVAPYADLF